MVQTAPPAIAWRLHGSPRRLVALHCIYYRLRTFMGSVNWRVLLGRFLLFARFPEHEAERYGCSLAFVFGMFLILH